jgi:hypothetical protein
MDVNELAAFITAATTDIDLPKREPKRKRKNLHAVALGRKGGKKGGLMRAQSLTPEQRSDIARSAAAARWKGKKMGQ